MHKCWFQFLTRSFSVVVRYTPFSQNAVAARTSAVSTRRYTAEYRGICTEHGMNTVLLMATEPRSTAFSVRICEAGCVGLCRRGPCCHRILWERGISVEQSAAGNQDDITDIHSDSSLAGWKLKCFFAVTTHQCRRHNFYYKTAWNINSVTELNISINIDDHFLLVYPNMIPKFGGAMGHAPVRRPPNLIDCFHSPLWK